MGKSLSNLCNFKEGIVDLHRKQFEVNLQKDQITKRNYWKLLSITIKSLKYPVTGKQILPKYFPSNIKCEVLDSQATY